MVTTISLFVFLATRIGMSERNFFLSHIARMVQLSSQACRTSVIIVDVCTDFEPAHLIDLYLYITKIILSHYFIFERYNFEIVVNPVLSFMT